MWIGRIYIGVAIKRTRFSGTMNYSSCCVNAMSRTSTDVLLTKMMSYLKSNRVCISNFFTFSLPFFRFPFHVSFQLWYRIIPLWKKSFFFAHCDTKTFQLTIFLCKLLKALATRSGETRRNCVLLVVIKWFIMPVKATVAVPKNAPIWIVLVNLKSFNFLIVYINIHKEFHCELHGISSHAGRSVLIFFVSISLLGLN